MSGLSRVVNAVASATSELTVAAVNLNINFALIKLEAPAEFQGLGDGLTLRRKQEAEVGSPHQVARLLGALFEDMLPPTPNLVKAYGTRASKVIDVAKSKFSSSQTDTAFEAHAGADGTSIWAAATSGSAALQIHLLTCMLVRVWNGPEATSILAEILKERKREITAKYDAKELVHFNTLSAAAQPDPSRSQLADWVASAYAWLRTADQVKFREQKQLMLILDNLDVAVEGGMKVYTSVMAAWKTALNSMEALLRGMPQSLQSGATLLCLGAWHLYPDLIVLAEKIEEVKMRDELVPAGGVLTIGLQTSDRRSSSGVTWSLSLAHLRYYGHPVPAKRSFERSSGRITLDELGLIALGSLLSGWKCFGPDILLSTRWFSAFKESVVRSAESDKSLADGESDPGVCIPKMFLGCQVHWMQILCNAAATYLESSGIERETYLQLIELGKRRGKTFIRAPSQTIDEFWGLVESKAVLSSMKGPEERISYLRHLAERMNLDPKMTFIRYLDSTRFHNQHDSYYEYCSVRQRKPMDDGQGANTPSNMGQPRHERWMRLTSMDVPSQPSQMLSGKPTGSQQGKQQYYDPAQRPSKRQRITARHCESTAKIESSLCHCIDYCQHECPCVTSHRGCSVECHSGYQERDCGNSAAALGIKARDLRCRGEACYLQKPGQFISHSDPEVFEIQETRNAEPIQFSLIFGDPYSAAIFTRSKVDLWEWGPQKEEHTMDDLIWAFESDLFNSDALVKYVSSSLTNPELRSSLRALSAVFDVYKLLPGATISVGIMEKPLAEASWARKAQSRSRQLVYEASQGSGLALGRSGCDNNIFLGSLEGTSSKPLTHLSSYARLNCLLPWILDRCEAFSCITYLESGYDIPPEQFTNVMAVSSGDSIFLAARLVCDPFEVPWPHEIRRIMGNVGRAGIALLIPPSEPMTRETDIGQWNVVKHAKFDGEAANNFGSTSLHLTFTEYVVQWQISGHGARDHEVFFLESVISVKDRMEWLADIDILAVFDTGRIEHFESPAHRCEHEEKQQEDSTEVGKTRQSPRDLISIDTWEELFDLPEQASVVRANGNWVARLATAVVNAQRIQREDVRRTVVCPKTLCWKCCKSKTDMVFIW
jgi:hypothetical protein